MLADYGWQEDGKLFLTYRLSAGTLANGIVSVPAGMKHYLVGAHELRVAEGAPIGRLVVKDSQAWGLGHFSVGAVVNLVIRCEYFLISTPKRQLLNWVKLR